MRRRLMYVVLAAFVLLAVGASSTFAARGSGVQTFIFNGRLLADAGSSSSLYVDVNGGNRLALKKLVGQSDNQHFAVDSSTQFLRWSHGVPTVVAESNLVAGDAVSVHVRGRVTPRSPRSARRPLRELPIAAQRRAMRAGRSGSSSAASTLRLRTASSRFTSRAVTGSRCARCSASRRTSRSATALARSSSSGAAASRPSSRRAS